MSVLYDDLCQRMEGGQPDADAWLAGEELPSKIARREAAESGLAALAGAQ